MGKEGEGGERKGESKEGEGRGRKGEGGSEGKQAVCLSAGCTGQWHY